MTVFKSLLEIAQQCDKFPYTIDPNSQDEIHHAIPFILGPYTIGNVLPSVVLALKEYNSANESDPPFVITNKSISFASWVNTPPLRTSVVKQLMDTWRENKTFEVLAGWRNELYPVYGDTSQADNIAFVMERASAALFGISTFGAHLNAYTKTKDGQILMWVARRSKTKQTWPGLLDNCVSLGHPINFILLLIAILVVGCWRYFIQLFS
jgi:hypothetical protein